MDETVAWRLSDMANGMERSRILSIAASVRAMIAEGKAVAPFTVGDFSPSQFEVPSPLIDAIIEAVSEGETNYPPAAGLPELRSALVPAWNNHYYVHLNGAIDIPIQGTPESRFLPTASQIESRIEDIRVLILNSPLNPTGTCFTANELRDICHVVLNENRKRSQDGRKPVILVYDQVYSTMTADGIDHVHPVQVCPEIFDYTITLDAISKSLTGTGLRLGWMALPPALAPPVVALIGHMGAWPARPIQKAAAKLYENQAILESYFDDLDDRILTRMSLLKSRLEPMSLFRVNYVEPEGGIYLSTQFDLFELLNVTTNEEIRQWLLEEAGVAVVPFQAFGLEEDTGWFRISIGAVSVDDISQAMDRLEQALTNASSH